MYSTADATRRQAPDDAEQAVHLRWGQRRGRLVEDEDLGVRREGPGQLHELHLGDAQLLDRRVGRDVEPDLGRSSRTARLRSSVRSSRPRRDGSVSKERFSSTVM